MQHGDTEDGTGRRAPVLAERVARGLAVIWLIASCLVLVLGSAVGDPLSGGLKALLSVAVIFVPAGLLWLGAHLLRLERLILASADRRPTPAPVAPSPATERLLGEVVRLSRQTEQTLARLAESRSATPAPTPPDPAETVVQTTVEDQPSLAFEVESQPAPADMSIATVVRALNFPDSDADRDGFVALRQALLDPRWRQVIQASQDVLTLLSQDGIYMDDLKPDLARPELWRRFAAGERGRGMAALGGVRDRSSLALAAARMREDTIFRDAAHHFLRRFDRMLVTLEPEATDEELVGLSDTRTARAFMLLGRVSGTFD